MPGLLDGKGKGSEHPSMRQGKSQERKGSMAQGSSRMASHPRQKVTCCYNTSTTIMKQTGKWRSKEKCSNSKNRSSPWYKSCGWCESRPPSWRREGLPRTSEFWGPQAQQEKRPAVQSLEASNVGLETSPSSELREDCGCLLWHMWYTKLRLLRFKDGQPVGNKLRRIRRKLCRQTAKCGVKCSLAWEVTRRRTTGSRKECLRNVTQTLKEVSCSRE